MGVVPARSVSVVCCVTAPSAIESSSISFSPVSATYTLPLESTARATGVVKPLPNTVCIPLSIDCKSTLPVSAMYRLPNASTATPLGPLRPLTIAVPVIALPVLAPGNSTISFVPESAT